MKKINFPRNKGFFVKFPIFTLRSIRLRILIN
ncbi:hypothetical protein [Streptococcus pyogenes SSI-1]|nr:hypothetical protein [Streptococcus pyogenes SSI-1]